MHLERIPGFYWSWLVCVEHGGLWCPGVVATPSRHWATRVIKCEGCKEQIAINLPNTGHHHHLQRTAERASKRVCVCVCVRLYCSPMDGGDCEVCPGAQCMSAAAAVVTRGGHGRRIWDSACSTNPGKAQTHSTVWSAVIVVPFCEPLPRQKLWRALPADPASSCTVHTIPIWLNSMVALGTARRATACLTRRCGSWCDARLNRSVCLRPAWHWSELVGGERDDKGGRRTYGLARHGTQKTFINKLESWNGPDCKQSMIEWLCLLSFSLCFWHIQQQ